MTYTVWTRACIVRENLAKGYGVEDIAAIYKMPLAGIRYEVKKLRENGALKAMYRRGNDE